MATCCRRRQRAVRTKSPTFKRHPRLFCGQNFRRWCCKVENEASAKREGARSEWKGKEGHGEGARGGGEGSSSSCSSSSKLSLLSSLSPRECSRVFRAPFARSPLEAQENQSVQRGWSREELVTVPGERRGLVGDGCKMKGEN